MKSKVSWLDKMPTWAYICFLIVVAISTWFITKAVIPDKTKKDLLLQQREQIYSEIYE